MLTLEQIHATGNQILYYKGNWSEHTQAYMDMNYGIALRGHSTVDKHIIPIHDVHVFTVYCGSLLSTSNHDKPVGDCDRGRVGPDWVFCKVNGYPREPIYVTSDRSVIVWPL